MFALSLEYFLFLLGDPSTNIVFLYQKYHLKTNKIFKEFHVCLNLQWGLWDRYWLRWKFFASFHFHVFTAVAYANMLLATQWPMKRAPHLPRSLWYGGLEAHWGYLHYGCEGFHKLRAMPYSIKRTKSWTVIRMIMASKQAKFEIVLLHISWIYTTPLYRCHAQMNTPEPRCHTSETGELVWAVRLCGSGQTVYSKCHACMLACKIYNKSKAPALWKKSPWSGSAVLLVKIAGLCSGGK